LGWRKFQKITKFNINRVWYLLICIKDTYLLYIFLIYIREYENKIIDDILVPTGVTLKPSDNQIKEFLKRLKSLNKDLVYKILLDKVLNYQNMTDQNSIKTFTVKYKY